MKDKTILNIITLIGVGGWAIFFRKGPVKDWLLVYLFKATITTLIDIPIAKKKLVQYPKRYFPGSYDTNIIFDYVIFPLVCVLYSQLTNKMKGIKTLLFVFILSVPMTIIEELLERKTGLVKYSNKWSWLHTLIYLTITFWSSRIFISLIRLLDQIKSKEGNNHFLVNDSRNGSNLEDTQTILHIKY
ncbi:CBO0543 family protein [Niallia nealsonii]|uniref:Uncharacterized protein n=1 Tax=Niallia nealsonii TaxID=115979 RepID=A0A2N0Z0A8_9BACI|nr:CBO0543 family protein [Niallia nealsonii]PKG22943.1 hypothetical protein CWS01_14805 [Niallia nealsonii]